MKMGRKYLPTRIRVNAAIHSYEAMARPILNPEPDMPMNCSAEMLAAMREAPTAHQGSDLLARK